MLRSISCHETQWRHLGGNGWRSNQGRTDFMVYGCEPFDKAQNDNFGGENGKLGENCAYALGSALHHGSVVSVWLGRSVRTPFCHNIQQICHCIHLRLHDILPSADYPARKINGSAALSPELPREVFCHISNSRQRKN